jgi:hypothetical protein
VGAAVALGLQHSKLLDRLRPRHISLFDVVFDEGVLVALAIHTHLQVVIDLVGLVFAMQLALQLLDVLIRVTHLLDETAAIATHPVQLLKHQVQAFLQRSVIHLQLNDVLV